MLHLIIAEAALETIPRELWSNPIIRRHAAKRGKHPSKILLDLSYHYPAAKRLKDIEKRGRPDITHFCLLEALGSLANRRGTLKVYVHTYNDKVIYIDPETRLPRHYLRFVGLIEQLFEKGKVPPKAQKPLLWVKDMTISELVKEIGVSSVMLMTEKGEYYSFERLVEYFQTEKDTVVIIGGFQRGDFKQDTYNVAKLKVSIFNEPLEAWVVISRVLTAYEKALGLW